MADTIEVTAGRPLGASCPVRTRGPSISRGAKVFTER